MLYAFLKTLHLLSIIVWVGGMVFAHFFLRPALAEFEPALRLRVMNAVLGRFFAAVLAAASLALLSGGWMIGHVAKRQVQSGVPFNMPLEWIVMAVLGLLMVLIFGHIRFVLYRKLGRAVTGADWPAGALALGKIRLWVMANLVLGVLIILVTLLGVGM